MAAITFLEYIDPSETHGELISISLCSPLCCEQDPPAGCGRASGLKKKDKIDRNMRDHHLVLRNGPSTSQLALLSEGSVSLRD